MAQRKIIQLGLTVWIDPIAKKKKKLGVKSPVEHSFARDQSGQGERSAREGRGERGNFSQAKQFILAGKNEMHLIGCDGSKEPIVIPSSSDEFYGQMKFDPRGNLLYRLIVPLDKIGEIIPFKESNILSLGFETGYINQPSMQGQGPGGNSSMRGGGPPGGDRPGGGGPPGGGRPGGGNPGQMAQRQQEMQQMTFPLYVWVKNIRLAEEE